MSVFAFDFGMTNIGVAVAEPETVLAFPLTTLHAQKGKPAKEGLSELLHEWQIEQAVVGLPINMDGSESEMCAHARRFAESLSTEFNLTVELVDERLSTREAREISGRQVPDHSIAAKVIAETWLQMQSTKT